MFCPYCGKPNKDDGKFCVHCGKSLLMAGSPEEIASNPEIEKHAAKESPYIYGYKYPSMGELTLDALYGAIEKKGDFNNISSGNSFRVYQNKKGDKTIITYKQAGKIFVFGDAMGRSAIQTRYFSKVKIQPHNIDPSEISNSEVLGLVEKLKQEGSQNSHYLDWRIDKNSLTEQVENYSGLGWTEALRKQASLLLLASITLTGILAPFNILGIDWTSFFSAVVIYLPLAIFMFKGHRWAFIVGMVLWTIEKGYSFYLVTQYTSPNIFMFFMVFVWWATFMKVFWQAFKVEQARRDVLKSV